MTKPAENAHIPAVQEPVVHIRRQLLLILAFVVILGVLPLVLQSVHVLNRPDTTVVRAGNIVYYFAVFIGIVFWILRLCRANQRKPLTGVFSRQGFASVWVGVSGLVLLSAFAPRFPESALTIYWVGAGIVILYALIPILLFQFANRKMKEAMKENLNDTLKDPRKML